MKEKLNIVLKWTKLIVQWVAAVFCFLGAVVEIHLSSLFLIIAGVLFLPVKKIRAFLLSKLKIRGLVACLIAIPFLFVGVATSPTSRVDSSVTESITSLVESKEESSEEESSLEEIIESSKEESSLEEIIESSEEVYSSEEIAESSEEESFSEEIVESSEEESSSEEIIESSEEEFYFTYILNTNSKKIHYSSCWQADKISESNKEVTHKSLEELLSEGYTTCKTCFK